MIISLHVQFAEALLQKPLRCSTSKENAFPGCRTPNRWVFDIRKSGAIALPLDAQRRGNPVWPAGCTLETSGARELGGPGRVGGSGDRNRRVAPTSTFPGLQYYSRVYSIMIVYAVI